MGYTQSINLIVTYTSLSLEDVKKMTLNQLKNVVEGIVRKLNFDVALATAPLGRKIEQSDFPFHPSESIASDEPRKLTLDEALSYQKFL